MNDLDLHRRLTAIERRLARLEGDAEVVELPPEPAAMEWPSVAPPPLPPKIEPKIEPLRAEPVVARYEHEPPIPAPRPATAGAFEQTVGLKWAAWGGAILSAIAVALGVKYAYDQGWLGGLPDAAKLVLMSLGGLGLIAAGEWVYRRVNRLSAVGLYAAGVASLFVVSYAGFGFYEVYARETAFALMALSALIGAAVAVRGRLASVGILSLVGGNVAPLLLGGDAHSPAPLLLYLLALQLVALFLAWWGGGPKWWAIRGVSLATTALWTATLLLGGGSESTILLAACGFAALYQIELVLSALRSKETDASTANASPGAIFSVIVTALLACTIYYASRGQAGPTRGLWLNLLAAAVAALAAGLRAWRPDRFAALSAGFAIQAAALVVASVPVALIGGSVVIAWAILAVAFAALGRWTGSEAARTAGVATWGLAVGWLAWGAATPGDPVLTTWATLFSVAVPQYLALAGIVMVAGHSIALLIRPTPEGEGFEEGGWFARLGIGWMCGGRFKKVSHLLNAGSAMVWGVAAVNGLPPAGATVAILCHAWSLALLDYAFPRRALSVIAVATVAAAGVKWAVLDLLEPHFAPDYLAAGRILVNGRMAAGLLIAGSLAGIGWLKRGELGRVSRAGNSWTVGLNWAVLTILTLGLAFEVDAAVSKMGPSPWPAWQVRQLSWTVLLAAALSAGLGLVRWMSPDRETCARQCRIPAWLTVALALKYALIDTLGFRLLGPPAAATVVANGQTLAGVAAAGSLGMAIWTTRTATGGRAFAAVATACLTGLLLWVGTLEIDRWASVSAAPGSGAIVRQAGWSVWWGAFAVAAVVIGFARRTAALRYFGLILLAVTLGKVVTVDFLVGGVGTGARILSFAGLGLLLLGTSVLYGKLSPKLLKEGD